MKKQAWIQDPKTANTARFHWDPKSWSADPMHFVDSGRPLTGASLPLKTRRQMLRDAARTLWQKLQERKWRQANPQRGDAAEARPGETQETRKHHASAFDKRSETLPPSKPRSALEYPRIAP
jgi:hypothetical protein